ncbi:MAG: LLM class flavin-dependent oxidoreductase [Candidatus Odinarchaeia archaeon]
MNLGVNVIGIAPVNKIIKIAKIAENAGFHSLWVGEGPDHRSIFPILAAIAHNTRNITLGTSILSVHIHKPVHILKSFELLINQYGDRFIIGIGKGGYKHLKMIGKLKHKTFPLFEQYLKILKANQFFKNKLYLGATGLETLKKYANRFDGVLMNFISPQYISEYLNKIKIKSKILAIGPSSYLPDKNEEKDLIYNCALIASEMSDNVIKMLKINMEINNIRKYYRIKKFEKLSQYKKFLINNFSISGSLTDIKNKVEELDNIGVDELIFGHPITSNLTKFKEFADRVL